MEKRIYGCCYKQPREMTFIAADGERNMFL